MKKKKQKKNKKTRICVVRAFLADGPGRPHSLTKNPGSAHLAGGPVVATAKRTQTTVSSDDDGGNVTMISACMATFNHSACYEQMYLNMSSAVVVCCMQMLTLISACRQTAWTTDKTAPKRTF